MSDSSDNPSTDFRDQVEARLVAMMLGEASAFDEELGSCSRKTPSWSGSTQK